MSREDEIVKERLKKIEQLRDHRINPYPHHFDKKNSIQNCLKTKLKAKVKTAGRVLTIRDFGKISFAKIQDSNGEMQIVLQEKQTPNKDHNFFKKYIDSGDFIGIEGIIIKTKTGEKSILIKNLKLLSKSILPLPSKWHGLMDKEERYRKRYLDLIMNPQVRNVFEKRALIIDSIREFLKKQGFLEVETPTLQTLYGGAEAKPFKTYLNTLNINLYLSISPELYLKRLIIGSHEKVFTICKNFRNEGIDKWHNPEFTMLEVYQAYSDYNTMMELFENLVEYTAKKVNGITRIKIQDQVIDFKTPWKKMTMIEAIKKYGKINVNKLSEKELKKIIDKEKIPTKGDLWGHYIIALFEHFCASKIIQPTFIIDHPLETTPLCKLHRNDPECRLIERFEPFCLGIELGNAYSELNDPIKQRELLELQQKELNKGNEEANPLDEDFLTALEHGMPPTGGLGLGIDRLVTLLTQQSSIKDVILFPFMKPENSETDEKQQK